MAENNLITEKEAAEYLAVKVTTLQQWRFHNKGPKYYKLGGSGAIRYKWEDLEAYAQEVEPDGNKKEVS